MSAFLHPLMLWGLALAAVPLIIHLLNRRRYRTVRWAAMDFLRRAFKKNQRRLRFENLLLLLLRTAIILLIVFGLARPFLSGSVAGAIGGGATHYTVLLDSSYSMGFNEGVTTPFERGVKEVLKVVSTLGAEDSISLYLTNDHFAGARPGTPRAVFRDTHDPEKARKVLGRISALRTSAARSSLVDSLAEIADRLDPRVPGQEVLLVTDLQRTSWENAAGTGEAETIGELLGEIDRKGATVHLIDVGPRNPANVAVHDFRPVEDRPLVERSSEEFRAIIRNYDRRAAEVDVTFTVDGELKGSTRVTVPPAPVVGEPGEKPATFTLPPLEAGDHTFGVEIPADSLRVDDRRLFTATVRERIRVLAVDGDPDGERSPETFYLKWAIAPVPDRIEVEVVDYLSFLKESLADVDVVVLANLERVREDKVRELERFVSGGGGLVVFLGDRVDPTLTNRNLGKDGEGLLPATLAMEPITGTRDQTRVRLDLDASPHPLLDGILGPSADPDGFWKALSPRVWGYYKLTVDPEDEEVSVLLRLTDPERSPALVERRFGKGHVLLFATAADLDWSDFPAPGVSIPLLHETIYYLTRHDPALRNITPYAALEADLPDRVEDVQVVSPNGGKTRVAPILEEGRPPRVSFAATGEPGLYRLQYLVRAASAIDAESVRSTELYTVNVDAAEGDIRRITPQELATRYPEANLEFARTFSSRVDSEQDVERGEIWKGLVLAVLALLVLEMFLARRFGDYGRRIKREVAS